MRTRHGLDLDQRPLDATCLEAEGLTNFYKVRGVGEAGADPLGRDHTRPRRSAEAAVQPRARTRRHKPSQRSGRGKVRDRTHSPTKHADDHCDAQQRRSNGDGEQDGGELQKPDHERRLLTIHRYGSGAKPPGLPSLDCSDTKGMQVDDDRSDHRGQRWMLRLQFDGEQLQSIAEPVHYIVVPERSLHVSVRGCGRRRVLVAKVQLCGELLEPLPNGGCHNRQAIERPGPRPPVTISAFEDGAVLDGQGTRCHLVDVSAVVGHEDGDPGEVAQPGREVGSDPFP